MIFWKYHGLGNDFVLVENFQGSLPKEATFVKAVCDRHFGVGADGILYVETESGADARMVVMNSDGSEAEMCGNGIRCVAKHLYDLGIVHNERMIISTLAGMKKVECVIEDGVVRDVIVDMGAPSLDCADIPMRCKGKFLDQQLVMEGGLLNVSAVSMGNPHLVVFDPLSDREMERLGPILGHHPLFPRDTNVEFVKSHEGILDVRVFERGAGWTKACGTGACATAVAAALRGMVPFDREVEVRLPGGSLWIMVEKDLGSLRMRGPAQRVYRGEME